MFPITAASMIAAAAALLMLLKRPAGAMRLGLFLALAVTGVGLVGCILRALQWAPGPLTLAIEGEVVLGKVPGSITSLLFVAVGLSLILMHTRRFVGVAQTAAAGTLLFSMLVLLAYLFQGDILRQLLPNRGGIAAHTALAFLLLSTGVLYLRPNEGVVAVFTHSVTARSTVRGLLLPAIAGPILVGVLLSVTMRVSTLGFDDTSVIWVLVSGLITVLVLVVWRFAYRLQIQEERRKLAEQERDAAMAALHAADENKNIFLATLAHELKNPLAAIGTGADLLSLMQTPKAEQVRRTASLISRQTRHMAHLVDDLMDISRVMAGIIVLDKKTLDVKQIVCEALEQVQPVLTTKGHQLRTEFPPRSVAVLGDRNRLVQVFANLIGNSARYTPDGGHLLLRVAPAEGKVVIKVEDDGIGIAPEQVAELFNLFTQAKRKADRSQGGLGLGLALVKSLVELHGGQVTAHSEGLGKGSSFTVILPETPAALPADHQASHDLEPRGH